MIKFEGNNIKKIYLGDSIIKKVYLGNDLLFEKSPYLIAIENEVRTSALNTGFDLIANDNYMIMTYRDSIGSIIQFVSDFYASGGGYSVFGLCRPNNGMFGLQSYISPTSTALTTVKTQSNIKTVVIKKESGIYSYTLDGITWSPFNSYYKSGSTSSELIINFGRTDRFVNDHYGFYIVEGVNQQIVDDFFNQHNQ